MEFIKRVSLYDVLAATPNHEPSKEVTRKHEPYAVWRLECADLASVGAQLPDGTMGTIESLLSGWLEWIQSNAHGAQVSRDTYERYLATARDGRPFEGEPILLGERRQIHDGRHRLFAAFACAAERPDLVVHAFWNSVLATPRQLTDLERKKYPIPGGIVTVDDPEERCAYNCHGFAIGVPETLGVSDGPSFLEGVGYVRRPVGDLRDTDQVVALFDKGSDEPMRWHCARRLMGVGEIYESKFGCEPPVMEGHDNRFRLASNELPVGLRVVHQLDGIREIYGGVHSFWVRDSSPKADTKRREYLKREYYFADFEEVEDSSAVMALILAEAKRARGRTPGK